MKTEEAGMLTALRVSPILPPLLRYVTSSNRLVSVTVPHAENGQKIRVIPLRSVDTPVEKRPLDATANEPPRSTWPQVSRHGFAHGTGLNTPILAIVPP